MSRKDYIAIAEALSQSRPIALSEHGQAQLSQWQADINAIADVLAQDNPRFNRERFVEACSKQAQ